MRLRRLDLTRYGKFTDYSIDFGEHVAGKPDLHIVYGLNEAGKSTSLAAYLDLLFGIEERSRYGFLHSAKAMEIGGCLEFDGEAHEFRRVKQRSNSLLSEYGQPVNEATLSVPLAGLTRDAYRMMFSLDEQTLEDGGNAILESKGDLGELLFSASAGLAGIGSILEATVAEADGIFRKRASTTKIAGLKRQLTDLKSRRDDIDILASAHRSLTAALQQADEAYDGVMRDIGAARARYEEIGRILRAYPLAGDYRRGQEELEGLKSLPYPPAIWSSALPDLIEEETRLQTRLATLEERKKKVLVELDELVVDEGLLDMAEDIDRLTGTAARSMSAEDDLPKRKAKLEECERRVALILATLGQADVAEPTSLVIPAATIGTLRDLIADKSGIDVARQVAEKEHEAARLALEKERADGKALDDRAKGIDAGTVAKLQSTVSRLRDSNLAAELRLAERNLPIRQRAFEDALAALHPWRGDGDELRRIDPPDIGRVESWKQRLASLEKLRSQASERESALAGEQEETDARIAALRETADMIDGDEAGAILRERDDAWAQHLAAMDRATAKRFEERMHKTDAVAAARLDNAKALEELRSLSSSLAVTRAQLGRQRELLHGIDTELDALRSEIRSESPPEISLVAGAPIAAWLAQIGKWTGGRVSALSAWDEIRNVRRDAETLRNALEAERQSLGNTLADTGLAVDELPLPALLQAAENALSDNAMLQSRQRDTAKRLDEATQTLNARKKLFEEAVAASETWQRQWTETFDTTWFSDRQRSVGAVRELLEALTGLPEALREQDEMRHRIDAMETDRKQFADAVAELFEALGDELDGRSPHLAAKALTRRLDEVRQVQSKRLERDQSLVDLEKEREQLAGGIAAHAARKKEMTDFFGVETLADVRAQLERCGKRDGLTEQLARVERQIVSEMQRPSLKEAMAALADADLAVLQKEQAGLATRLEDLDGRAKSLFADKALASDRLNAIGGDDAVARIEATRRTVLLEIEDLALRFLRLRTGNLVAEQALRAYRDKHRSAMMMRASEAFRLITREDYTGLAARPEKDREELIGTTKNGGSKLATEMSKGTRFQLYLALRLAGYEEFATARPSVPFIADDIMETFDEPRSEEVFRLFGQMAEVGQVIYLTHHRHLCDIAGQVVPNAVVHEIR